MIGLLASWLLACGGPDVDCPSPRDTIAETPEGALTCRRADWLVEYWEVLRASALPASDRRLVRRAVARQFEDDATGTLTLLERVRAEGHRIVTRRGPESTGARSRAVYDALNDRGVVSGGALGSLQRKLLPVWSSSDEARVSLTEADVEGWIHYASLCREVQGGTPLRISVAGRVGAYRAIQDRFAKGSAEEQVAMAALGATWPQIRRAWLAADYETQQAWIADAPLPGPLEVDSIGYLKVIVASDVAAHVDTLRKHFGPFTAGPDRPMFLSLVTAPR